MKQNIKSFISQRMIVLPTLLIFFYGVGKGQNAINNAVSDSAKGNYTVSVENGDSIYRYIPKVWTLRPTSEDSTNQAISKVNNVSRMSKVSSYSYGSMDLSHIPNSYSIDNTKDIGEITINQSGGNGSVGYSVPINAYQTPNGMSPSVQLAYNSMSGNGIAGYGWQLGGLSSISVTNSNIYFDGKPTPAKTDNTGAFTLDGQRLINLGNGNYQTEQGNIKVTAYISGTAIKYFQVYYPNGNIATLGFTTNTTARVSYPITNIKDLNGNTIDYTYTESNNIYYITEINYGGRTGTNSLANFTKISFNYESRNDISLVYVAGVKLQQDKRLKEIKTYFNGNLLQTYSLTYNNATSSLLTQIDCTANSKSLNPLKFYYGENNQVVNFTKNNILLGSYFSNASAPDLILSKGKFDQYSSNDGLISYPNFNTYGLLVTKTKGGKPIAYQYGSTYSPTQSLLVYSDLSSGIASPTTITTGDGFLALNAMDVDGDGKDELVKINTSFYKEEYLNIMIEKVYYYVYDVNTSIYGSSISLRNSFGVEYNRTHEEWSGLYSPTYKAFLEGDFSGDGKQTVLAILYNKNIKGENIQSTFNLIDFDNKSKKYMNDRDCFSLNPSDQVFVMDFDGDGKADICRKTSSATEIYTFDSNTATLAKIATYANIDLTNRKMLLGDINGDGKTDIVVSPVQGSSTQRSNSTWSVYYSTGTSSGFDLQTMNSAYFESDDKLLLQDMDGDGKADLVVNNSSGLSIYLSVNGKLGFGRVPQIASVTGGKDAFLIAGNVENGYRMSQLFSIYNYNLDAITFTRNLNTDQLLTGAITSTGVINKHQYSSILSNYSIYDRGTSCTYPYRNLAGNLFLLSSSNTYLSGALLSSASTKYTKGVLDIRGKGFVGFEKVESYDNLRSTTTTQNFNPLNFGVSTSVDGPTASATYTYNTSVASNKIVNLTLATKTETNKLTNASVGFTYTYDSYGNPTSEVKNYGNGLTTTTTNLYYNYTETPYKLGVLYDQSITNNRNLLSSTGKKTLSNFDATTLLPQKVTIKKDGNQVSETTYTYQNGQVTDESTKNYTASTNLETKYAYDTYGRLSRKIDPLGLYVDYAYDTYGRVASVTDHKNNTSTFGYDNWGRKRSTVSPDGVTQTTAMQWVGAGSTTPASSSGGSSSGGSTGQIYRDLQLSAPLTQSGSVTATNSIRLLPNFTYNATNSGSLVLSIDKAANFSAPPTSISGSTTGGTGDYMYLVTKRTTGGPTSQHYMDALGREMRTGTMRFDGNYLYSDKTYDSYGRLDKVSLPFKGNTAAQWNTYSYDTNDRLTGINYASGKTDSYSYSNLSVSETKDGITKTTTKDATGKVVSVTDPAGTITYNLRADGQPSSIVALGNVTTCFTYDVYGRQLTLVDPSSGTITYTYDARGNLNSETDARGKIINTNYDDYNRITQKEIVGEFTTAYGYNTDGQLETVSSTNGTGKTMTYDNLMRLSSVKENAPDAKYLQKNFAYNAGTTTAISYVSQNGAIATENYSYTYGTMTETKLNNTNSIWKLTAENDLGLATASVTGNLLREYGYDAYGLPTSRTAKYGTNVIQSFGYNFNSATGNLNWRKDNNRNLQEDFSYDNLNRLTGFGATTIAYDIKGNITDHSGVGSYAYENTAKPYAVTTVTPYGTAIPLRDQDVTYNGMQRPVTITENGYVATFSYDDGGERVKMLLTHNGTTQLTRYYLGGQYEIDAEAGTERLYLGGDAYSASAVYVKEAGNWNIYYICRDYQGSITHIVDANGSLKQELSYDPWGRLRDPNTQQVYAVGAEPVLFLARGYTGHEHLTVFGLINMNARLYDPALGRFLSPDPYVQSPENSQNFNRYSYCLNNPLRYSDPTGMLTWNDIFGGISLIAGIALEFVPGMQALGTSLIVAGFSHFAYTIDQMQNSNMNWNQASNYAGFQFSTTIGFNHASAKENKYNNGNTSAGNMNPNIEDYPDSRLFQGSDYDAAMLSKMLTENDCGIEHPYISTHNGFYFEPTSGYIYNGQGANGENLFSFAENGLFEDRNGDIGSIAHNYNDESYGYINIGTVMNREQVNYRSHFHHWGDELSKYDNQYTETVKYPLYVIGYKSGELLFSCGGVPYHTRRTLIDVSFGLFYMNKPWSTLR
jgi:RHS repeat-associated protein